MKHKGFSLIELLIVVTITLVIFSFGIASFNQFNKRERLRQAGLTLKSSLRYAQSKALSADKPNSNEECSPSSDPCCTTYQGVQVSFTASGYSTRHACTPEGPVGPSTTITFPTGIVFTAVPSTFTFLSTNTLDRTTDQTITLTNGTLSYVVEILSNGVINDQGMSQ